MISYPIAEIFESVQGEGGQAGIAMTFVRLAGCTVGKPYTPDARKTLGLEVYQERCTSWDGSSFPCDTAYRMKHRLTLDELMLLPELRRAYWVSITGGEPLMHDLVPLMKALDEANKGVHIETSGTIGWYPRVLTRTWITVSPKAGVLNSMLAIADEIRVMVGDEFSEEAFLEKYLPYIPSGRVWISPVNGLHTLDMGNVQKCLALQQKYRELKLTTQMHKVWNVR